LVVTTADLVVGGAEATAAPAHLPLWRSLADVIRCIGATASLLGRHRVRQPTVRVDRRIRFADGSSARIYRETVVDRPVSEPAVLIVGFRLRGVRGVGHALFRLESELNTPLFVGFPGFVSKLWLAIDQGGTYRGIYQWDGAEAAASYARALWWVLALVCPTSSIHWVVLPGRWRDQVIEPSEGGTSRRPAEVGAGTWWRPIGVEP